MSNPSAVTPSTKAKIGIIGPKEVGKTALANTLNGYLKSLGASSDLVHESARRSPLPLNEKTTIGTAYWSFGSQIMAEALVQETRQFTICDRTVIDIFPFYFFAVTNDTEIPTQNLENLKILIKDYLTFRPYDFLFYIPIREELWDVYSRPEDPTLQSQIDREFRNFINESNIQFTEIKALGLYERLKEIMNSLESRYIFHHRLEK